MSRSRKHEQGFTLVELLVVIIIIGILAAVAIPAFLNQRQRANDATVQSDIKNISVSVESLTIGNPRGPIYRSGNTLAVIGESITETVKTSPGVDWDIYGSSNGYCITAWHSNGKSFTTTTPLYFDSARGGIKSIGQVCGTTQNAPDGTIVSSSGGASEPTHYSWIGTPSLSGSKAVGQSGSIRSNLSVNPSFEVSTAGFTAENGATFIRDTSSPISGLASGKLTGGAGDAYSGFSVVPGDTVTISVDYKTVGTVTGTPRLLLESPSPQFSTNWLSLPTSQPTPGRFSITKTFDISGTAYIGMFSSAGATETILFDNILIEKTSTAGKYFDGYTTSTF